MAKSLKVPFCVYVCPSSDGDRDESNISSFRFEHREVPAWEDMKAMVKAQYDINKDILLKHIDADHEEITIGSQEEWRLAVKASEKESNQLFIKMYVLQEKKSRPQPSQPPQSSQQRRPVRCNKEALRTHIQTITNKVDHLTRELSTVKLNQQQQEEIIRQAATTPVAKSSENESRAVVHEDVNCSLCRHLVTGIRYKCINCSQYNLCEKCEKSSERSHPETHVFLKVIMPIDRNIDAWISKAPLLGCNLYDSSSVERFLRKFYRSHHRRRSSSGSSSSSTSDSPDTDSEHSRILERRRNRRRRHERTSSNSTSTHDTRRRRKYRRRRSSSTSSGTSTGSSSTGSSSSMSTSIITLDSSSKRQRKMEMRRYHKDKRHQRRRHPHRHHDGRDEHRHHHGHRHHHHHGRRHRGSEKSPMHSRSSAVDVRPPSTVDCMEEEMQQLVDWADNQQVRRARQVMEEDTIPEAPANNREALKDVMMTEQELQKFRARLNKLVDVPAKGNLDPENSQEYFVQTGCGLGDWVPITDQPSVSAQTTEEPASTCEFTLIDTVSTEQQQEQQSGTMDVLEPEKIASAPTEQNVEPKASEATGEPEAQQIIDVDEDPVEAVAATKVETNKSDEKTAKGADTSDSSKHVEEIVDLTVDGADGTTSEPNTAAEDNGPKETTPHAPEVSEPQSQPLNTQTQQPIVYPQQHYPQYQQYPIAGGAPIYPYPAYPPAIDGQTAANLWSATTNVLRSMQSGWQGIVGGQNPGPVPAPAPEVRQYEYQTNKEMQQLIEMGFCNRELNQRLLEKHNQNVDRVVSELINDSNDSWFAHRH